MASPPRRSVSRPNDGGDSSAGGDGFPQFDHNQWTVEGEIERFGAFGRGAARAHGPKRWLAVFLVLLLMAPLVAWAAMLLGD